MIILLLRFSLSFYFFVCFRYIWSGLIVILGIYLNVYSKNRVKWDAAVCDTFERYFHPKKSVVRITNLENIV